MSPFLFFVVQVATVADALVGVVFLALSDAVMRAWFLADGVGGAKVMKVINRELLRWVLMILSIGSAVASAQEGGTGGADPLWTLTLENDAFFGSDENFTGAWKASRTVRAGNGGVADRVAAAMMQTGGGQTALLQLALGQSLFTPETTESAAPLPNEHPYAALLYGEASLLADRGPGRPIDVAVLQLGVIGPAAFGEDLQNTVHRANGGQEARGWHHQIGNQPIVTLGFSRRWTGVSRRIGWLEADITPGLGATIGNAHSAASAGATLRIGRLLGRPYGEPGIHPTGGVVWYEPRSREAYLFLGAEGRLVGYDVAVEGRPFKDDTVTQEGELFMFDLQGGFVLPLHKTGLRVTAKAVRRSPSFEGQENAHLFGSMGLSFRF